MKVSALMTRDAVVASPDDTLRDIAALMATRDLGFLPVGENDRLVGMITDRDMVVRGLTTGMDGNARVREVMTRDVKYCFEDEEMKEVIQNMGNLQVRRLPVVNREKRLVGVVSLADAALKDDPGTVGIAMSGVVEPGGMHAS